jgi:Tat protein translocase TatB subunit
MFNIGPLELMVILIVALVVVGPKRLPEVGKTIGKSLREFRRATDEVKQSFDFNFDDDDFEPDPPSTARHVETLPDDDEFPARHIEALPEADEIPGERFDGFEEPDVLEEPGAPHVLDGHQATTEMHASSELDSESATHDDSETVEMPNRNSMEERPEDASPASASGGGERPASPSGSEPE